MPTQALTNILGEIRPSNIPNNAAVAMNKFRQEVCQFIQQRFPLHHERVGEPRDMGSKQKGTHIAQDYDLDIFVPFSHGYLGSPRKVKAAVHKALQGQFHRGSTTVRNQRVSVGLRRRFDQTELKIDLVPGVERTQGAYSDTSSDEQQKFLVLYDSVSNCERVTNIHRQVRLVKQNMQNYRGVVRLLKAWKHKHNHVISSYALELLVYRAAAASGAPKSGSVDKLLIHTLNHAIPFLQSNGALIDIGAGISWADYLKPSAKVQLAGLWKKLLKSIQAGNPADLRNFFL